jgi:DNA-directed RNA polymerase specialized sigma24 family protein
MASAPDAPDPPTNGSVTGWIGGLRTGDTNAARVLWERFFDRMLSVARRNLRKMPGAFDEEDVALSAFWTVWRSFQAGGHEAVQSRHSLWKLLAVVTVRKASDRLKIEGAAKRGGGRDAAVSVKRLQKLPLDELPANCDDPHFAAMMADECRRMMAALGDDELAMVALMKLEGLTNDEIAGRLGYSRRTIQRMLSLIRDVWGSEF